MMRAQQSEFSLRRGRHGEQRLRHRRRIAPALGLVLVMALLPCEQGGAAKVVVNRASATYDSPDGRVTVTSNDASTLVTRANAITGRVKDESGAPVKGAKIEAAGSRSTLAAADDIAGVSTETAVVSTLTASDGTYSLTGMAAGTYDVYLSAAGRVTEVVRGVTVGPDAPTVELETRMPAATAWRAGLHLVALPFEFASPDPAAVFGVSSGLKIARWSPSAAGGRYVYWGQDVDFGGLGPGVGCWMRVDSSLPVAIEQPATPASEGAPYVVRLTPGWNLVGNPFAGDVEWGAMQVRANGQTVSLEAAARNNWVRAYGWTYDAASRAYGLLDASYRGAARTLRIWQACWVRALIQCELLIPPPGGAARSEAASTSDTLSPEWSVQLVARVGELRDSYNYLGVAADAAASTRSRLQSPPQLSPYVDLAFSDGIATSDLATDFRTPVAGRMDWQLVVRSDVANAQVELTWPDLSEVPHRYRMTLVDVDTNRRQYMRTTSAYVFNTGPAGAERRFRVEVDPTPWARLAVSGMEQVAARASGTTVSYDVSAQAMVDIEIRTLAGQLVKVLTRGASAAAGTNLITWDGTDNSGRMMPSGPYLCSVSAVTDEGQAVKGMRTIVLRR